VVDPRVKVAVVSGYFNLFEACILGVDHCVDNYIPGMAQLAEMPDLVAAIAPRRLFVENGDQDPIFPVKAFRKACSQAEAIYKGHNCPENFGYEIFPGDHFFHGAGAYRFLEANL
jgi:hypothetical protein